MVGSSGQYTSSFNVKVESVSGQMTYTVIQDGLKPGRKYRLRIVPNVRQYGTDYPGVPSDDVEVDTLVPGKERVGDKITPRAFKCDLLFTFPEGLIFKIFKLLKV